MTLIVREPLTPERSSVLPKVLDRQFLFGPFRLLPLQRMLLEGDRQVPIRGRALDILIALVENAGALMSKQELMDEVWPKTFVDPANLTVNIAALRRALGDGRNGHCYLVNIPGRGYRFIAPVKFEKGDRSLSDAAPAVPVHNVRLPLRRPIGRDKVINTLTACLAKRRLITLVGLGGVGKTMVACAVANEIAHLFRGVIRFVDLSALKEARLVAPTVAAALGMLDQHQPEQIAAFLKDRNMLLVLDSCEHVTDAAAALVSAILREAGDIHVLATSREPLQVDGEYVHRLPPLDVPGDVTSTFKAADALTFPAVQLLVERAAQSLGGFELRDNEAPTVAAICSMLDGIPLAIEFASAKLCTSGIGGLACNLASGLHSLRAAGCPQPSRHASLRTTFDWSYDWLTDQDRFVLRRVSLFSNAFGLESARAVMPHIEEFEICDCLVRLVKKSLISADVTGRSVRYSLRNIVRAYCLEKLHESGELGDTRRLQESRFGGSTAPSSATPACRLCQYATEIDKAYTKARAGAPVTQISRPARWRPY